MNYSSCSSYIISLVHITLVHTTMHFNKKEISDTSHVEKLMVILIIIMSLQLITIN